MSSIPPPLSYAAPPMPADVPRDLAAARLGARKLRRAAVVATTDAWMLAIFAALSFVCGLFSGVSGVLMGMAMAVIAFIEFDGAARIRRLDPTAAKRLGFNQLALASVLIVYSLWSLHAELAGGGLSASLQSSSVDLGSMGAEMKDLARLIAYCVYGTLVAVAIFVQGGTALYYFTRKKHIHQYIETTPQWIVEMQRNGSPL